MTYQAVSGVMLILVCVYGMINKAASWKKYSEYEKGMFNLTFTFFMGYFFLQMFK